MPHEPAPARSGDSQVRSAQTIAAPGRPDSDRVKRGLMKVIRGGFGSRKTPSIGLVLGAGGVVGQAYQAGVLSALAREVGWDPREATMVVGTSAGAVTGAALRR